MRSGPFIITFDDEAFGGPENLLYLMRNLTVEFRKGGKLVAHGVIDNVDDLGFVLVIPTSPSTGRQDGETMRLSVFDSFDEVIYL